MIAPHRADDGIGATRRCSGRAPPPGSVSTLRCRPRRVSSTGWRLEAPGHLPRGAFEEGGDDSDNVVSSRHHEGFVLLSGSFFLEATMKKILLTASFLALMACTASAEGLNLGWSDCPTGAPTYHLDENFACNTNTGVPHILVGTYIPPAGLNTVNGNQ